MKIQNERGFGKGTAAGQHPLLRTTRPGWYFQPGKHGGTINDLGIHVADIEDFLGELDGTAKPGALNTSSCLSASRLALNIQAAA